MAPANLTRDQPPARATQPTAEQAHRLEIKLGAQTLTKKTTDQNSSLGFDANLWERDDSKQQWMYRVSPGLSDFLRVVAAIEAS